MANDSVPLFNYYLRYPWGPADFTNLQDAVVDIVRDSFGGLHGAGVVFGGTVAPSGSVSGVTVTALTAFNDDGYLLVTNETRFVDLADGNATHPRYDLVVARPLLSSGAQISRPTSPYETVDLTTLQQCQLAVVQGTAAASPSVPSKLSGDVIVARVYVPALATSILSANIWQAYEPGKTVRWTPSTRTITAPANSAAHGLVVQGDGVGAGLHAKAGTGTGAGSTDDAIRSDQNIYFAGTAPDFDEPMTARQTKGNLIRAWGSAYTDGEGAAWANGQGFNVASVTLAGAYYFNVTLAAAVPNMRVFPSFETDPFVCVARIEYISDTNFRIFVNPADPTDTLDLSTDLLTISFLVVGN